MNKFSFWLWNINGILIFGLVATIIYNRPSWLFENQQDSIQNAYYKPVVSWGSVLVDAKKFDTEKYENYAPSLIATGTQPSGSYMLTSVVSSDFASAANNVAYFSAASLTNLIFSDSTGKNIYKLLDKPAYIHSLDFNTNDYYDSATGQYITQNPKNLLYKISFEDTNQDGLLNELDMSALYVSDADGKNLKRLSPEKTTCINYEFVGAERNKIRILYFDGSGDGKLVGEQKFMEYDFTTQVSQPVEVLNKIMKEVNQGFLQK
ncbi:MAG: hypothetical protein EAZ08_09375 [Cytophagales bacterium]|nr:MAG: hypothetical protein EAZ08_09375 [Cytophagales bacterium]